MTLLQLAVLWVAWLEMSASLLTASELPPIQQALREGEWDTIKALLKANPQLATNRLDYENKILHEAARSGRLGIVGFLVTHGANVSAENESGATPLHEAVEAAAGFPENERTGHLAIVEFLLDHGADVNATDHFGRTPLRWAAENGMKGIAQLLLSRGA